MSTQGSRPVKFAELPIGALFRFNYMGLPALLAKAETREQFRKVAADGAVDIAEKRRLKIYVPPETNVVPLQPETETPFER